MHDPSHPAPQDPVAVVVPHTHWDREWYSPFETMRFALVQFLDELVDVLETEPGLPAFLLDGQAVLLEDYLEIRRDRRDRLAALVRQGRLRPGPFYVQPDEFHTSGEALVRNLLIGCQVAGEFGPVMREGYLPDTFGHVQQLPQILRGFGIGTFYAMRGFGEETAETGTDFFWRAPDGSRVRVHWLAESYSNAAVLTSDPETLSLHHGTLVGYDRLPELLERLAARSATGVLLLLNGGDHLRVQHGIPAMVSKLDAAQAREGAARLRLGGLEDFHRLAAERPGPDGEVSGELRHGRRHDVFDGIGSTRTPLKRLSESTETRLCGVAERLDALAGLADGRSQLDSLRYAWRELVKNHAHDSICGCSVDEVHREMEVRFARVGQVAEAVTGDALARIGRATGRPAEPAPGETPLVVVNPSAFPRAGQVTARVVPDLQVPLGVRRFGWAQQETVDWDGYVLLGPGGERVPFTARRGEAVTVEDTLDRRKEVRRDELTFHAAAVPPLAPARYRLVPAESDPARDAAGPGRVPRTVRAERTLANDALQVQIEPDGTLALTDLVTGARHAGLLEILEDADAGDTYGHGPLAHDTPVSSRAAHWQVTDGPAGDCLTAWTVLAVPARLAPDRTAREESTVDLPVTVTVRLPADADRVEIDLTVENTAEDHRLRLRLPTGIAAAESVAETAYGVIRRPRQAPDAGGWRDEPTGARAMRRFAALEDDKAGLAVLTEGLYEYAHPEPDVLDVTLLRSVGWLARQDHPLRPHKVGPLLPTPDAQCPGRHTFRLALRPYGGRARTHEVFRTAEEFAVPLLTHAVHGARTEVAGDGPDGCRRVLPSGVAVDPAEVVMTAFKTAEDDDGVVLRVVNSCAEAVTATVDAGFALAGAWLSDLQEKPLRRLSPAGGRLEVPLAGGQIATVRLYPAHPPSRTGSSTPGRR